MSEHPQEQLVSPLDQSAEFTGITEELEKLRAELSVALFAASEFLKSEDQPPSRAEQLLIDIDFMQEAISASIGLTDDEASRAADITPQLESIALLKLG